MDDTQSGALSSVRFMSHLGRRGSEADWLKRVGYSPSPRSSPRAWAIGLFPAMKSRPLVS